MEFFTIFIIWTSDCRDNKQLYKMKEERKNRSFLNKKSAIKLFNLYREDYQETNGWLEGL